jgi:hypothetical protein
LAGPAVETQHTERPHSAHRTHFEPPFGVRFQAMHSRFAKMTSCPRGGDVTPTGRARAPYGAISTIVQNVATQRMNLAKYDIIFSFDPRRDLRLDPLRIRVGGVKNRAS